ncbi:MAG: hypothetical protein ACI4NO_06225, partial [Oxalobacter sp.]
MEKISRNCAALRWDIQYAEYKTGDRPRKDNRPFFHHPVSQTINGSQPMNYFFFLGGTSKAPPAFRAA